MACPIFHPFPSIFKCFCTHFQCDGAQLGDTGGDTPFVRRATYLEPNSTIVLRTLQVCI